jgi:hypothetical protein
VDCALQKCIFDLEVFMKTGVTHLPVMETTESNEQRLRGLLFFQGKTSAG